MTHEENHRLMVLVAKSHRGAMAMDNSYGGKRHGTDDGVT
jgi:hypothetical protein